MNRFSGSKGNEFLRKCYNCGATDHIARECPKGMREIKCFKCGKLGHKANGCNEPTMSVGSAIGGPSGQKPQGRVFALDRQAAQDNPDMVTGMIHI